MKKAKNLLSWAKENIWIIIFLPIILPLSLLFRLYVWLYILAHCNIIKWADGMIDSNQRMNMKKIIFLDIDGVLNSGRWFAKTGGEPDADGYGVSFDPAAVDCLGRIISETGAEIVISSSWKWLASIRCGTCGKTGICPAR